MENWEGGMGKESEGVLVKACKTSERELYGAGREMVCLTQVLNWGGAECS